MEVDYHKMLIITSAQCNSLYKIYTFSSTNHILLFFSTSSLHIMVLIRNNKSGCLCTMQSHPLIYL